MVVGVAGAGTMGAGIAALAAARGLRVLLHDPDAEALSRAAGDGVEAVPGLAALGGCDLVVEAVPEDLALKRRVLGAIAGDAVLATNTSSLSVTEIAAAVERPERVVGLHFFNPVARMALVEVVAGARSSDAALATARAAAEAMGKRAVTAPDVPGFLVNRVNRPFSLEALTLLEERVASVEAIDRVLRMGAGFRMGPFAQMDLVGLDVNHAVAASMHRASFGEPRYRPSPLAARQVAAGRLGRKTGAGWYAEPGARPADPAPPEGGAGDGRVVHVLGDEPLAAELRAAVARAGFALAGDPPWLTVTFGPAAEGPVLRLVRDDLLAVAHPEAAGFHAVAPFDAVRLVELTRTPRTDPAARERSQSLFDALGRLTEPVEDVPGLVTGRVVGQLVNEAFFFAGAGHGSASDVDAGLELGLRHPRGPFAWAEAIGLRQVVATLDGLHRVLGDPRYRVAPLLRRRAAVT